MTERIRITGTGTTVGWDESPRVWVTLYGKRYHSYERCRYLDHCAGTITETTKQAEYRGKTPCPECGPLV